MAGIEHYSFSTLGDFVTHLRGQEKKVHLLFAYNGTGKTRLSMDFRQAGKTFVEKIMSRMIFDGEKLTDLLEPLELSWKERRTKELALMEDLVPQLKKLAEGREISGLAAYE